MMLLELVSNPKYRSECFSLLVISLVLMAVLFILWAWMQGNGVETHPGGLDQQRPEKPL